ncbi:hypothetical protein Y032_0270g873 [Ancylostoma ceylanicum]|nr:hypothetical protein Y032_0270g873 [Ancylostoma ceylanicum]
MSKSFLLVSCVVSVMSTSADVAYPECKEAHRLPRLTRIKLINEIVDIIDHGKPIPRYECLLEEKAYGYLTKCNQTCYHEQNYTNLCHRSGKSSGSIQAAVRSWSKTLKEIAVEVKYGCNRSTDKKTLVCILDHIVECK